MLVSPRTGENDGNTVCGDVEVWSRERTLRSCSPMSHRSLLAHLPSSCEDTISCLARGWTCVCRGRSVPRVWRSLVLYHPQSFTVLLLLPHSHCSAVKSTSRLTHNAAAEAALSHAHHARRPYSPPIAAFITKFMLRLLWVSGLLRARGHGRTSSSVPETSTRV